MPRLLLLLLIFLLPVLLSADVTNVRAWKAEPVMTDHEALVKKFIGRYYSLNVRTNGTVVSWHYTSSDLTRLEWSSDGKVRVIRMEKMDTKNEGVLSNRLMDFLETLGVKEEVMTNAILWDYSANGYMLRLKGKKYWQGIDIFGGDQLEALIIYQDNEISIFEYLIRWMRPTKSNVSK